MKFKRAVILTVAASLAAVTSFMFAGCEWFSFKKKINTCEVATETGYSERTSYWIDAADEDPHAQAYRAFQAAYGMGEAETFEGFLQGMNGDAVARLTADSIVTLRANGRNGFGFVYTAGAEGSYYIVTPYDAVCDSETYVVATSVSMAANSGLEPAEATYVGGRADMNIAVYNVKFRSGYAAEITPRGSDLIVGERVLVVGPMGEAHSGTVGTEVKETALAKADGRQGKVMASVAEFSSESPKGIESGAVFDGRGKLVGMVRRNGADSAGEKGYAIPYSLLSSAVQNIIDQSKVEREEGSVCRGALVARLGNIDAGEPTAMTDAGGLSYTKEAVLVSSVDENGPFASTGLKEGDAIVKVEIKNGEGSVLYTKFISRKYELDAVLMNVRKNNKLVLYLADDSSVEAEYTENSQFRLYE